jgi:CheY-like chemotaxis protein
VVVDDSIMDSRALGRFKSLLADRAPRPRVLRLASLTTLAHAPVTGEPWFDAYLTKPVRLDAVLMDCQMPVMDGFTATRELRKRQSAEARIPVIALTADTTMATREACFAAGMNDYLGKPCSRASLRAILARWLPTETTDERVMTERFG